MINIRYWGAQEFNVHIQWSMKPSLKVLSNLKMLFWKYNEAFNTSTPFAYGDTLYLNLLCCDNKIYRASATRYSGYQATYNQILKFSSSAKSWIMWVVSKGTIIDCMIVMYIIIINIHFNFVLRIDEFEYERKSNKIQFA